MSETSHAVHGMGRELAEPDWLPLTDDELRGVLGRSEPGGLGRHPVVIWRSPRPMSAAALVRHGDATVFVKRHHLSVRNPAQLTAEHAFATHLRTQGLPVPAVLRLADGRWVLQRGEFCYEAHQVADGLDVYRDAVSWSPYRSLGHAYAAGGALARLHLAAEDFGRPARPPAVLMNSCAVITAAGPLEAASRLVAARPALAAYLARRSWPADFCEVLAPLIRRAAPLLAALRPQWGHGDWHPSNLTWTSASPDARVAGIIDFGLANRTFAVHDLALALERAVVSWLDLPETGTARADLAAAAFLLDGYRTVRPLTRTEAVALPLLLPVVHVEYALSEVDYFTSVVVSPEIGSANADLAYEYLIGHARWFGQPAGAALLGFLEGHLTLLSPHACISQYLPYFSPQAHPRLAPMSTMDQWTAAVCADLGLDPSSADLRAVLDLTRDVAHGVARPAAPLTAYLVGVAVGRGLALPDAAGRISALAASWEKGEE